MRVLLLIALLLTPSMVYADAGNKKVHAVHNSTDTSTITVNNQEFVWTKSMRVSELEGSMGVMYKMASAGAMALTLEQSYDKPATEGVNDSTYIQTSTINAGINTPVWQMATIDTVSMPFIRFKVKGATGNSTNSIQIKIVK